MTQIRLSERVYDWTSSRQSIEFPDVGNEWDSPYRTLNFVEDTLSDSIASRESSIASIKRALSQRLADIDKIYNLSQIPRGNPVKGRIEILRELDVVKPLMIKKLLDLRNAVEHHKDLPPSKETCEELGEFVWYFLNSTEHLYWNMCLEFVFEGNESREGFFHLNISPKLQWKIAVHGRLHTSLIDDPNGESIIVDVESMRKEGDYVSFDGSITSPKKALEYFSWICFQHY